MLIQIHVCLVPQYWINVGADFHGVCTMCFSTDVVFWLIYVEHQELKTYSMSSQSSVRSVFHAHVWFTTSTKKNPILYLCLFTMCVYVWVWIVVCARHMCCFLCFFPPLWVLLCMCVSTQYVSEGFQVRFLTLMVWEERKWQEENHTKWSMECAWFGDYIGPCAWENTKGSFYCQTDERWRKELGFWLCVVSAKDFSLV